MGITLVIFLASNIAQIIWNIRVGRAFVLLDFRFLTIVDEAGVRFRPIWGFKGAEINDGNHCMLLRFNFANGALVIPYTPDQAAEASLFVGNVYSYAANGKALLACLPLSDRIAGNAWVEFGDTDLFLEYPAEVKYGLTRQPDRSYTDIWAIWRTEAIAAAAATLMLLFAIPRIVDDNAFRWAVKEATATAYREYLSLFSDGRHREDAKNELASLYNRAIEHYSMNTKGVIGAQGFAAMLRYLRDRDLFEVPVTFESQSAVMNLAVEGRRNLMSVEPSFRPDIIRERERAVIKRIKESLGRIFPADIMTVEVWRDQPGPRIAVWYRYGNLPGSFYYAASEKDLDLSDRTWYYGIEIQWKVALFVPDRSEPLHSFALRSEPAPNFSVQSQGNSPAAIAVYERMAETAYDDFVHRFNSNFLTVMDDA
jgi:hypothetical protein